MKPVATIILNRNLPEVTDSLYEIIQQDNADVTDIYVVESGSSKDNLSQHYTWWANWEEALAQGLRYPRGFNYGLCQLWKEKKFQLYDYFFLVCNDTEIEDPGIIHILLGEVARHPRVGILSPGSEVWGETLLIGPDATKYFWHAQFISWLMRREYIESIMETENPTPMNFLFDGANFRGYGGDIELIVKGYANDWATAITTKAHIKENESWLKTRADLMKTDAYDINVTKVFTEGKRWMRQKYGFNSRWSMQLYSKFFYERFFEFYPEFKQFKI